MDQVDARERGRRQPSDDIGRVTVMQPDIFELARRDRGQRLRHAVDERLDPDEAGARMLGGFLDEMLAAAEADFKPHMLNRDGKQRTKVVRPSVEVEREARQQRLEQRRLRGPECVPLAPSEERALAM